VNDVTRQNPKRLDAGFLDHQKILDEIGTHKEILQMDMRRAGDIQVQLTKPGLNAREVQILREQLSQTQTDAAIRRTIIEKLNRELNGR
jgi:hypothetical protein